MNHSHNNSKVCPVCETEKPHSEFHKSKKSKDGCQSQCKSCKQDRAKTDEAKAYQKKYAEENKESRLEYWNDYRKRNAEKISDQERLRLLKVKTEAIQGYGGKCSCCGETVLEFLAIDHVNCNGAADRKENGRHGKRMYSFLIKNNFPKEYRVLCHNCNWSAFINGGKCIHQIMAEKRV